MSPAAAALEFLLTETRDGAAAAISFALAYEDSASTEDYAEYLHILETKLSNLEVTEVVEAA